MNAHDVLLAVLPNVRAAARSWARRNDDDAQEFAQMIAVKFLESWGWFRGDGTLRHIGGWVKGIARNIAIAEYRKRSCYRRHLARLAAGETRGWVERGGRPRTRPVPKPTPSLF
jgi:DNA-directed RNA polymerase specialized sigma24 family protein